MSLEIFYSSFLTDWLSGLEAVCGDLIKTVFCIETMPGLDQTALTSATVETAFYGMYSICTGLLVLKLITKGSSVYLLWRDGDPDNSPSDMVTGAIWALVISAAFPVVYRLGLGIIFYIVNTVVDLFPAGRDLGGYEANEFGALLMLMDASSNLTGAELLTGIVYVILLIILFFQMLGRGAELLIWRLGVPIAAVGLVNSDGGAWHNYLQMLLKQFCSSMIQYFCIALGLRVMTGMNMMSVVVGIGLEVAAFSAPKLLSQVMTPRGGGMVQKAASIAMIVRTFVK